ncbi:MAG: redoxin domain-containing protein [Phycisphaerae bacterium]
MKHLLASMVVLTLAVTTVWAGDGLDQAGKSDVEAKLLADVDKIQPGRTFTLGIHLKMGEGWHTYWKNPGDAGLATSVQFDLPEGFSVSKLHWPRPETFTQPGDIDGYGYSDQVLLTAKVQAPAKIESEKVKISAHVEWLGCKDKCIPGSAKLSETLAVGKSSPANEKLFATWQTRTPAVAPDFALIDHKGDPVQLSDYRGKTVVLEWINWDCPFVKRHHGEKTMKQLAEKYDDKDVVWLGINSTKYADQAANAKHIQKYELPYAVLDDHTGRVGRLYDAKTTPHMVIIDPAGLIAYDGAIDDDPRGKKNAKDRTHYVADALDSVLPGRPVAKAETKPYGCSVKYAETKKAPSFALQTENGRTVALDDLAGKIVVLEWINWDCPFVVRHKKAGTMNRLAGKYAGKDVVWLGINSTHYADSKADVAHVDKYNLSYHVLSDSDGKVGKAYSAKTTPHMVIIDRSGNIAYDGAIDNDPRGNKSKDETVNHVEQALDALLAGKAVPNDENKPYGCSVKYAKDN